MTKGNVEYTVSAIKKQWYPYDLKGSLYSFSFPVYKGLCGISSYSTLLASKGASIKYLILVLVFTSPLAFAEKWYENGKPAESRSFQGAVGGFGAMILMPTDSQKVIENWSIPSPGIHILDAE